tara:strand:+ start:2771 stop:3253 length:483 start_codon:yes stop_codon:yes gene_type:complete
MKENKIIVNGFIWLPLDKRKSRFGGEVSPRKPEIRKPLLWLARKNKELYLVNDSGENLDTVIIDTGGFCTQDDDIVTLTANKPYKYKDVKPREAIKVDEFDGFFDLDFLLQLRLRVKSSFFGCIDIQSPPEKGEIKETVLIWDTGENGKYVNVNKVTSGC